MGWWAGWRLRSSGFQPSWVKRGADGAPHWEPSPFPPTGDDPLSVSFRWGGEGGRTVSAPIGRNTLQLVLDSLQPSAVAQRGLGGGAALRHLLEAAAGSLEQRHISGAVAAALGVGMVLVWAGFANTGQAGAAPPSDALKDFLRHWREGGKVAPVKAALSAGWSCRPTPATMPQLGLVGGLFHHRQLKVMSDFSRLQPPPNKGIKASVVGGDCMSPPQEGTSSSTKPRKKRVVIPFDPQRLPQMPSVFWEWLAGVIDGDGHLRLNGYHGGERSYAKMVIGMECADLALLQYTRIGLGGHGSLQIGKGAFLLALTNQAAMKHLVQRIGPHIHNTVRYPQLVAVCNHLGVEVPAPQSPTATSGWFAGFWDADGSVVLQQQNRSVVFVVSVSNVNPKDLEFFQKFFGGGVYFVNKGNGHSLNVWQINGREDVLRFVTYAETTLFHSRKSHRLHMVKRGFAMVDQRMHLDNHPEHDQWVKFRDEWDQMNAKKQQRKIRKMADAPIKRAGAVL